MKSSKMRWIVIIITILVLILVMTYLFVKKRSKETAPVIQNNDMVILQEEKVAILDKNLDAIHAKVEESENKQYVTLFIEGNVFEKTRKVNITYNSSKLILNTAQPLLEGISTQAVAGSESKRMFTIEAKGLENENIIFIKKQVNATVTENDFSLEIVEE